MAGASQVTGEQIWLLLASPELAVEAKMRAKKWVIVAQSWPFWPSCCSSFLGWSLQGLWVGVLVSQMIWTWSICVFRLSINFLFFDM